MASSQSNEEEARKLAAQLGRTLKEGERILGPSRRPDGTLRKPIRIRAGYVPQEEVAIYQSRGALWRKEMEAQEAPPGYDPVMDVKPKSKSVKRNERKKEKRLQAALENAKTSEQIVNEELIKEEQSAENLSQKLESAESAASQMCQLSLSTDTSTNTPCLDSVEGLNPDNTTFDIDKKIRALKKKIRLKEAQQQKTGLKDMEPEQLDKVKKLDGWREELKLLEDKKAELSAL
ncbi:hypothetical protein Ancab_012629 [Ancistrocladus abbreviatus]